MFGMSTACFFARMNLEDTIAVMAGMRCPACEIFLNTYSEYEPSFIALLKEKLVAAGMRVLAVHAMSMQFEPQLFSMNRRQAEDARKIFKTVLQGARSLGAGIYVMHGPALMRGAVRNVQLERIGAVTAELCDLAARYGVRLAWENVSWCLFSEPEFAPRIFRASGEHPNLFFTLDIKQAARAGQPADDYIAAMGKRIANVHLCDYRVEGGYARPEMIGRGEVDFSALKTKLDGLGYAGPVFLELYSDLFARLDELGAAYRRLAAVFG